MLESRTLQKAAESLLEMQGMDDVITIICQEAEKLTGADGSAIRLEEKGEAPVVAIKHGAAASRPDYELRSGGRPGAALVELPLVVRGDTVGTLVLMREEGEFDDDQTHIAAHFADQAAIAIQHVLFHQQHEQLAILEERQKLAHELHDSVSQSLYGVTMYGEAAARLLEANELERATEILHELRETALDALREMRLLVFELRPPLLEKEGLAAALRARLTAVEGRARLATEFNVDDTLSVPLPVAEALHGIAREALNNILKHARANRISVRLQEVGSAVALEITDDGVGFEPEIGKNAGGLGLQGMEERAVGIGARLTVVSRCGEGTTVRVEVPLSQTSAEPVVSGETP